MNVGDHKNDPEWRQEKRRKSKPVVKKKSGCVFRDFITECPDGYTRCKQCGFCPDVEAKRIAKLRQDVAREIDVAEGNIGMAVHFVRRGPYARQLQATRRGYR